MTDTFTTRETADHAELARLAEAASARLAGPNLNADGFGLQIWGDSLKGGSTHVLDVRGWGYLTGGGHGALGLSEDDGIAAQRAIQAYAVAAWNAVPALLSEIAALRGEVQNGHEHLEFEVHRADQAERQRDELRKALELAAIRFDEIYEAAEVDDNAYRNEATIHGINGNADVAQSEVRIALANQGADQ